MKVTVNGARANYTNGQQEVVSTSDSYAEIEVLKGSIITGVFDYPVASTTLTKMNNYAVAAENDGEVTFTQSSGGGLF